MGRLVAKLQEIDGVGFISAVEILAEIGDIRRFPSGRRLASYMGVAPSTYQSGRRMRHGRTGKGRLKKILFLCARRVCA